MDATDAVIVFVTTGSREQAEQIATALVTEALAACVNIIGPIASIYRWDNQLQRDEELLLMIKTRATLFDALAARVRALHSYQTPEVIAVPVTTGAQAYLEWLRSATRPPRA